MSTEYIIVTRHAKRYELGGRRHFEKIRLKVNVASRKIAHLSVFQSEVLLIIKPDQKRLSC